MSAPTYQEFDDLLTRAARLNMCLRKVCVFIHREQGHGGKLFTDCCLEPCATAAKVLADTFNDATVEDTQEIKRKAG